MGPGPTTWLAVPSGYCKANRTGESGDQRKTRLLWSKVNRGLVTQVQDRKALRLQRRSSSISRRWRRIGKASTWAARAAKKSKLPQWTDFRLNLGSPGPALGRHRTYGRSTAQCSARQYVVHGDIPAEVH